MLYIIILGLISAIVVMAIIAEDGIGAALFIFAITFFPWFGSYMAHAHDIATIQEQGRVISVYENRINKLSDRLKVLSTGDVKAALLNADSPIAAMVKSITEFEMKLAEAEEMKAVAYRSIAGRKIGFFNSVTWFFDDLPHKTI